MGYSPERFKAAPDQPEFTSEEREYRQLQERLAKRVGLKESDGGFMILAKALRGAISKDTIPLITNQWRQEAISRKIAESKPGLLNSAHNEATEINKKLDQLTDRVNSAATKLQEANETYSKSLDELEKFQSENLK